MNIEEAYLAMQEASGIEVGDVVKILRKATDHEMGWKNTWPCEMDEHVGQTEVVSDIAKGGITLDNHFFAFPFFVLEVVKKYEEFKPFDKVLMRHSTENCWRAMFFSYINKDEEFVSTGGSYAKYCIPYEGNEHLANTTKSE